MGLELGFNAYRREGDKFVRVALDDKLFPTYVCGRSELNYNLGAELDNPDMNGASMCFDAEMDGKYMIFSSVGSYNFTLSDTQDETEQEYGSGYDRLYYEDFEDFMCKEEYILEEEANRLNAEDKKVLERINDADNFLQTVLRLQMEAENNTAYENAKNMVEDAKADLASIKAEADDVREERETLEYTRDMFLAMRRLYSLGLVIIPFYSY